MRRWIALLILCWPIVAMAEVIPTSVGDLRVEKMLGDLDEPWAVDFLPNGAFLVTERGGALLYSQNGTSHKIQNIPKVEAIGQGGLLDVTVARDFVTSREIFLSFSRKTADGINTAVEKARLSRNHRRLENRQIIFQAVPHGSGGRHFGSRIVENTDGTLFITLGDRGERPSAQNLSNHNGTVVRINRDGSVPADNPLVGKQGVQPQIWSYGHRNAQGAALDLQGNLWLNEHGARGGDEVNKIQKAANYGWPVIAYGRHYSGFRIGEGTHKQGMQQPQFYWDPSIAPSGMAIYSGKLWSQWRGDIFVGSLKFDYIARLAGEPLKEVEQIRSSETARVRDVAEAPDGSLWFISVIDGAVYRLSPLSD